MPRIDAPGYCDESVPAHADIGRSHPLVVFGEHRLCAGQRLDVQAMPGPHMHSQIEINFVLDGAMTYWFDGREAELGAGRLILFWGMIPHQVTAVAPGARFACFYVPMAMLLEQPGLGLLRESIFRGAVVEARALRPFDRDLFLRWREELLSGNERLVDMAHEELIARLRRIVVEGWSDLRAAARVAPVDTVPDARRMIPIEKMTRYIGENGHQPVRVEEVARAAGLNPHYAMQLFKRAVGMTVKQAITRQRLDAARSMLIASDRSVTAIAFDCGFASLSSFYEAFNKRFATSPAHFRRSILRGADAREA